MDLISRHLMIMIMFVLAVPMENLWKPIPGTSNTKYGKMELVVMDLIGPISVPTWDGYVYALVVIEVSCQYPVGCLLKSKEEAKGAVRDVIAMLEYQSGLKVKRL